METASYHHHYLRRKELPRTPSLVNRRSKPENIRNHGRSAMPIRSLSLRQLSANRIIINPFQHPKLVSLNPPKIMAEEATIKNQSLVSSSTENIKDRKEEEESPPEKLTPPPPPEKPLPGDCCGSGCVRCVWDVYYEELEAYDNLYRNK